MFSGFGTFELLIVCGGCLSVVLAAAIIVGLIVYVGKKKNDD